MVLEPQTYREIISDHLFYSTIIIGITLSIFHTMPPEVWRDMWNLIVFLSGCALTMCFLSLMKSLQVKNIIEYANSIKDIDIENPFDEADKESDCNLVL